MTTRTVDPELLDKLEDGLIGYLASCFSAPERFGLTREQTDAWIRELRATRAERVAAKKRGGSSEDPNGAIEAP